VGRQRGTQRRRGPLTGVRAATHYRPMDLIGNLTEKCGISREQAEKVVEYITEHKDEVIEYLGKSDTAKGIADKVGLGKFFE
jgi:hypothetical protein